MTNILLIDENNVIGSMSAEEISSLERKYDVRIKSIDSINDFSAAMKHNEEPILQSTIKLTKRQARLIQLVKDGQSSKEISRTLNINELSVRANLSRLYKKLKIANKNQLLGLIARGAF
jgi:DNA-binding CsgD family transcriptional regulator